MKKQFGEYYLGLDMGTGSVGWAVTDKDYKIQKLNGKALWGVHLFKSGATAQERRMARTARRRQDRTVQRMKLLQELFAEEINKTDPGFFLRLNESFFIEEDKSEKQPNTLFNTENFIDKDYHKLYPTIYHLRKAFIDDKPINDPRLLYLAVAHIIKNRGHFLFPNLTTDRGNNAGELLDALCDSFKNVLNLELSLDKSTVQEILLKRDIRRSEKAKKLCAVISCEEKDAVKELCELLVGNAGSFKKLFGNSSLEPQSHNITILNEDQEKGTETVTKLSDSLQDGMDLLYAIKAVYDWSVLEDVMHGEEYLSHAKVEVFNRHRNELNQLKRLFRKYVPNKFDLFFRDPNQMDNYPAYIGMTKKGGRKQVIEENICSQEDLCKNIESIFKSIKSDDPELRDILQKAQDRSLLPKPRNKENSVIPFQLQLKDLNAILQNAEKRFAFLSKQDESGITVSEKIRMLLTFRIPYFVGPLNPTHKVDPNHKDGSRHSWITRKPGVITPWNFSQMVDKDVCAEDFIKNMTNKCTYLYGEDVLPKDSLLYSKFTVLNELNNLKIDGQEISVELKQKIYNELFRKHYRVKLSALKKFLKSEGITGEVSGIDEDFKSSLKPWLDFQNVFNGRPMDEALIEQLIENITLFSGTEILLPRLKKICKDQLSDEDIRKISKLKYQKWGKLSRKFLTDVLESDGYGECFSIMDRLWNTNENLMQLLSSAHGFGKKLEHLNQSMVGNGKISYENLEELYVSPAVKRSLWRTLSIVEEIRKIMGHDPEKIFIEVAREEGEKERTISRKKQLQELYKKCGNEAKELMAELNEKSDSELKSDKLFLYFLQMGKCMYSGEPISLAQLYDNNIYDVDHIYPKSKSGDDSLLNNKVLCKKAINEKKDDDFPINSDIRHKMRSWWDVLKARNLINAEKYRRLTRAEPFTEGELSGFIARQLVETRQACKAAADILKQVCPNTRIVYSRAKYVSMFRQKYKLIKVRDLNDLHHTQDAYLNIVVGNFFDTKFTEDPRNFFKQKDHKYTLKDNMFEYDVIRNNHTAWIAEHDGVPGTIAQVKKMLSRRNILFTRQVTTRSGKFYDINPVKRGKGQQPLKTGDERFLKTDENGRLFYGAFDDVKGAYAVLIEYQEGKKLERSIEFIPIYCDNLIRSGQKTLEKVIEEQFNIRSPKIIIGHIGVGSLLILNGFPMHLMSRTGKNISGYLAYQLYLSEDDIVYYKKVQKICDNNKGKKKEEELNISDRDGINKEQNIKLYDQFLTKLKSEPYSVIWSAQTKTLENGREQFKAMTDGKQCLLLGEIMKLFRCNAAKPNLEQIGGSPQAGSISRSKVISKNQTAYLINQSITGVFEKKIDLLDPNL